MPRSEGKPPPGHKQTVKPSGGSKSLPQSFHCCLSHWKDFPLLQHPCGKTRHHQRSQRFYLIQNPCNTNNCSGWSSNLLFCVKVKERKKKHHLFNKMNRGSTKTVCSPNFSVLEKICKSYYYTGDQRWSLLLSFPWLRIFCSYIYKKACLYNG